MYEISSKSEMFVELRRSENAILHPCPFELRSICGYRLAARHCETMCFAATFLVLFESARFLPVKM